MADHMVPLQDLVKDDPINESPSPNPSRSPAVLEGAGADAGAA
ncbi:hypothetical protein [Pseudarthrobacter sp. 1C304]